MSERPSITTATEPAPLRSNGPGHRPLSPGELDKRLVALADAMKELITHNRCDDEVQKRIEALIDEAAGR